MKITHKDLRKLILTFSKTENYEKHWKITGAFRQKDYQS